MNLLRICGSLVALFLVTSLCEKVSDYEIYELIDSLNALTEHTTFYSLLQVEPTATSQQIASIYRRMSSSWHPDKNPQDPNATAKFSLLSGIHTILKNDTTRQRYDWLVNEAPAWHRSSYYYSKFVTAKLSVFQVLFILMVFISVGQLAALYAKYLSDLYHFKGHQRTVDEIGEKEMKRLKRKVGLSTVPSSEMMALLKVEQGVPSKPKFSDLIGCQLVLFLLRSIKKFLLLVVHLAFLLVKAPLAAALYWRRKKTEAADGSKIEKAPVESDAENAEKTPTVRRKKQWQLAAESRLQESKQSKIEASAVPLAPKVAAEFKELKSGPFLEHENSHLIQLMHSVPAGTVGRWKVVAQKLDRSVDDVMSQVQELKAKLKT
jgi:hypothetical protein